MKKDKARIQAKKRQKDSLKENRRQKVLKKVVTVPNTKTIPEPPELSQTVFSDENQKWWLCHGINHILSNYKEGIWTPLFPEIYETGLAPEPEQIAKTLMSKYEGIENWPLEVTTALAWSVQNRTIVYAYYQEVIRQMSLLSPDSNPEELSRRPHNAVVWRLMHSMMTGQKRRSYKNRRF